MFYKGKLYFLDVFTSREERLKVDEDMFNHIRASIRIRNKNGEYIAPKIVDEEYDPEKHDSRYMGKTPPVGAIGVTP